MADVQPPPCFYTLSEEELEEWDENGCVLLRGVLPDDVSDSLAEWASEVAGWSPPSLASLAGGYTTHYERAAGGQVVLCRVENYTPFHKGLARLANELLCPLVGQLFAAEARRGEEGRGGAGEGAGGGGGGGGAAATASPGVGGASGAAPAAVLFKEKLNIKEPGGKGYGAHYDGPSAASVGLASTFITVQVAVDAQTEENGCLEVVRPRSAWPPFPGSMVASAASTTAASTTAASTAGSAQLDTLDPDAGGRVGAMTASAVASCAWEHVEAPRASLFLFHGLLPHKSGPNRCAAGTGESRRTFYMIFNPSGEGDHHEAYYERMEGLRAAHRARMAAAAAGEDAGAAAGAKTAEGMESSGTLMHRAV